MRDAVRHRHMTHMDGLASFHHGKNVGRARTIKRAVRYGQWRRQMRQRMRDDVAVLVLRAERIKAGRSQKAKCRRLLVFRFDANVINLIVDKRVADHHRFRTASET